ncbi:MAG: hypothetical protein MJ189_02300 [Coriobacteriales bacterium]|nr:hypothetical protein [Coriobacteriales bacterium]
MDYEKEINVNTKVQDSIFCDLFGRKKYMFEMYQCLHPEDTKTRMEDLVQITLKPIFSYDIYNDLGFLVNGKLIILVEAQSTWSDNIVVRMFLYLAATLENYIRKNKINLYRGKTKLPNAELYVIYTGTKKDVPQSLSISKDFFNGQYPGYDLTVRIIRSRNKNDIIMQYVSFCTIFKDFCDSYDKEEAINLTIKTCKNKNILKDYIEQHENEVKSAMSIIFDQEFITETIIYNERKEAYEEGLAKGMAEGIEQGIEQGKIISVIDLYKKQAVSLKDAAILLEVSEKEFLALVDSSAK